MLKYTVTPDEFEKLPEDVKAEYKQAETGSDFELQVDLDGSPIKRALEEERRKRAPENVDPTEREKALQSEVDKLKSEAAERSASENQRIIEHAVTVALHEDARVLPSARGDLRELAFSRFEVNDRGEVITKNADDVPDGRPIREWLDECARSRRHHFKASTSANGGRASTIELQANPWKPAEWSITAQRRIEASDPQQAERLRRAAGQ